ncbi:hypothetical protein ACFL1Q_00850 [Patescibacteria group bacterium]
MAEKTVLTSHNIQNVRDGFSHFFPEDTVYRIDTPYASGEFVWKNRAGFVDFITEQTGVEINPSKPETVKFAQLEAEKRVALEAARPGKEQLEIFEEELKAKKEATEEIVSKTKKAVEETIARKEQTYKEQQKLIQEQLQKTKQAQADLKNKKIYAKVDKPETPQLTQKEQETLNTLKQTANEKPQEFTKEVEKEIKSKIDTPLKNQGVSPEEVDTLSKQTAATIVENLTTLDSSGYVPVSTQSAILSSIAPDKTVVNKAITNPNTQESLRLSAQNISTFRVFPDQVARNIAKNTLGEKFSQIIFGPNPEVIKVTLSNTPAEDFDYEVDLGELNQGNAQLLENQATALEQVKDFGGDQAKSFLFKRAGVFVENRVASIPTTSTLGKALGSVEAKSLLFSTFGVGKPVAWEATNWFGGMALKFSPESAPFLSGLGKIIGVDFIAPISAPAVALTTGAVAETTAISTGVAITGETVGAATGVAAKKGISFLFSKAIVALGAASGWVTAGITTIASIIVGEIVKRIPWDKVKKAIPYVVGAATLLLWGPVPGVLAGLGTSLSIKGVSGVGISGAVRGMFALFGSIGKAMVFTIGTPIIVTIAAFPILVALILFIINSGAYIVPPSFGDLNLGGFTSPYVDVQKTASTTEPLENSALTNGKEIIYTITIKPKKGSLSNVQLSYDCQVISNSNNSCPQIDIEEAYKDVFSKPLDTLSATGITFTYKSNYDSSFVDSAIIDSVKLSAVSSDNSTVSTETSYSLTFGSPPITCPVPGAKPASSLFNYSYNASNDTGHGSTGYWTAMGGEPYRYALPQKSGCKHPEDCSYYGYAYDVFPTGTTEVFAPTVLGKPVEWQCSYYFANEDKYGSAGHTYKCISSDGNSTLVLTHMDKGANTGVIMSGEKIGKLYNQLGNTHLHMEFQMNGRWQKPENFFCK